MPVTPPRVDRGQSFALGKGDALADFEWEAPEPAVDDFPPAKSPSEIASILAELGEELGVWTSPISAEPDDETPDADLSRSAVPRPVDLPRRRLSAQSVEPEFIESALLISELVESPRVATDSVIELSPDLVQALDDEVEAPLDAADDDFENVDTIEPVKLSPRARMTAPQHALRPLPPRAPASRVPPRRAHWSDRDEDTATDMFVA